MKIILFSFTFFAFFVFYSLFFPNYVFAASATCDSPDNGTPYDDGDSVTLTGTINDDDVPTLAGTREIRGELDGSQVTLDTYYRDTFDPPVIRQYNVNLTASYPPTTQYWSLMGYVDGSLQVSCTRSIIVRAPPPTSPPTPTPEPTIIPCQEGMGGSGTCETMSTSVSGTCVLCGDFNGPFSNREGYYTDCPGGGSCSFPDYPKYKTDTYQIANCNVLDYDCTSDGGYTWTRKLIRNPVDSAITYTCEQKSAGCVDNNYGYCYTTTGDYSKCTPPPPPSGCLSKWDCPGGWSGCDKCNPDGSCTDDNTQCANGDYCDNGACTPLPDTPTPTPTPLSCTFDAGGNCRSSCLMGETNVGRYNCSFSNTCCVAGAPTPTPTNIPTSTPTPTGGPEPCSVTTSPPVYNLTTEETGIVTASVISGLGSATITQMSFGSYNDTIATVNPISDPFSPYSTTVTAMAAGATAVWGTADLSDGRTCQTTGATDTNINVSAGSTPTPTPTTDPGFASATSLVIKNPVPTPIFQGTFGFSGAMATESGSAWYNPQVIRINAKPSTGNYLREYYVAFYDQNSGPKLTDKTNFIYQITNRLSNSSNGLVLQYNALTDNYYVWNKIGWQSIYKTVCGWKEQNCPRTSLQIKDDSKKVLYTLYKIGATSYFNSGNGGYAEFKVTFDNNFLSKSMYTAVYVVDSNADTNKAVGFIDDITPVPN